MLLSSNNTLGFNRVKTIFLLYIVDAKLNCCFETLTNVFLLLFVHVCYTIKDAWAIIIIYILLFVCLAGERDFEPF